MPRVIRVAAIAVPLVVLLAGCADSSSQSTSPAQYGANTEHQPTVARGSSLAPLQAAPAPVPGAPANVLNSGVDNAGSATGGGAPGSTSFGPANGPGKAFGPSLGIPQGRLERSVTVSYQVPHGDFLDAFDILIRRAADLGGYVVSSTTTPGSGGRIDSGSLVVKVPSAKLNDMVTGTPPSWQLSSIDYGSVDHTAETIDLTARVKAITAHRNALQKLLDNTNNLNDITTLETQLADVQQQLDQVQGQLDSVNGRVDMATATISLTEKGAVVAPAKPKPSATPRIVQALIDGWNNAVAVISGVTLGIFSALPLLVIAALLLLGWRRSRLRMPA